MMNEYEAYDLVLQLLVFTHELGEGIQTRIEFWSAVSYGLIVLAYVAPNRLNIGIGSFVLILYALFSLNMLHTIGNDIEVATAGHSDALALAHRHDLNIESLVSKAKASKADKFKFIRGLSFLYVPGLFIGTILFFGFTCYRQTKSKKSLHDP